MKRMQPAIGIIMIMFDLLNELNDPTVIMMNIFRCQTQADIVDHAKTSEEDR